MAQEHAVSSAKASEISNEINKALKGIIEKHGLKLTKQTSGYGDSFKFSISAVAVKLNADGINLSSEDVIAYERFGYMGKTTTSKGLEFPELTAKIGTHFTSNGKVHAFAGVRSRGKNKIIGLEVGTKMLYLFGDTVIDTINKASK